MDIHRQLMGASVVFLYDPALLVPWQSNVLELLKLWNKRSVIFYCEIGLQNLTSKLVTLGFDLFQLSCCLWTVMEVVNT